MNRPTAQRAWLGIGLGLILALGNSAWSQDQTNVPASEPATETQVTVAVNPEAVEAAKPAEQAPPAAASPSTATPGAEPALKRAQPPQHASGKTLFNVMVALVVVILMIFATGWLLKRFTGFSPLNNRHLKIHASLSVGARERIVLVEVGGEQILVGVTPQQINHLHTLKEPIVSAATPAQGEFAQRLQAVLRKGKAE